MPVLQTLHVSIRGARRRNVAVRKIRVDTRGGKLALFARHEWQHGAHGGAEGKRAVHKL